MEPDAYREELLRSTIDHPTMWEYFGSGRYLQAAFSQSAAQSYAASFGTSTSKKLSIFAAKRGSLTLLAWTKDIGCDWTKDVFISAVEGGSIPCIRFVFRSDKSLFRKRRQRNKHIMETAAKAGNIEVIAWLHEKGFGWNTVIWLLGHGCSSTRVYVEAATHGHLEILKWMHANNHPIEGDASVDAAQGGQIHILEWLHAEMGEPFEADACTCAAIGDRLSTLQWLRAHRCPWDANTVKMARIQGHAAVEEWALANGCPEPL